MEEVILVSYRTADYIIKPQGLFINGKHRTIVPRCRLSMHAIF
jgi:hypothetical protein